MSVGFRGVWLACQSSSGVHFAARNVDGIVLRRRAVKELAGKTTNDDPNKVSGTLWASTGVLTEKMGVLRVDGDMTVNR